MNSEQVKTGHTQPYREAVNSLWIGSRLSSLEMLTLKSFTAHGHPFRLWVYGDIYGHIPEGVELCDATAIIPAGEVFAKNNADPGCGGIGKGSFGAPFSDLFRYRLLYLHGGWWTDMDVCLLKPLPSGLEWFFRNHNKLRVIGNVMRCPPASSLMAKTYDEVKKRCGPDTTDWLLPNRILNHHIMNEGLAEHIQSGISNNDVWNETSRMMRRNVCIPEAWLFIHWQNEELRVRKIEKDFFINNSVLGRQMTHHGILAENISAAAKACYRFKLGRSGNYYKRIFSYI
jgi:hypothetical protein